MRSPNKPNSPAKKVEGSIKVDTLTHLRPMSPAELQKEAANFASRQASAPAAGAPASKRPERELPVLAATALQGKAKSTGTARRAETHKISPKRESSRWVGRALSVVFAVALGVGGGSLAARRVAKPANAAETVRAQPAQPGQGTAPAQAEQGSVKAEPENAQPAAAAPAAAPQPAAAAATEQPAADRTATVKAAATPKAAPNAPVAAAQPAQPAQPVAAQPKAPAAPAAAPKPAKPASAEDSAFEAAARAAAKAESHLGSSLR